MATINERMHRNATILTGTPSYNVPSFTLAFIWNNLVFLL